ncbi:MAG: hypothetical protein CV088_13330 [Nitrospira sp. LK70]|nr:hypothetical protein [Nitrospira sp. LK70]
MAVVDLNWRRFTGFLLLREEFRGQSCIYLRTIPQEKILRVGETGDPWTRYKGGTAYALDAALHGSGNLFFAATAPQGEIERRSLEATLIYDLQPQYNNEHKDYPPFKPVEYVHRGDVPKGLRPSA